MDLSQDEELIIQGNCLLHRGLVAHLIEFVLTSEQLWYSPLRFIDRMVGIREETITLMDIENVQVSGIDKFICIQTPSKSYRFSQLDSIQLHSHLQTELQAKKVRTERRLTQDKCLFHRGFLAHPVEVLLTTERMFFYGTNFRDRLFGLRDCTIPTRSILSVELKGIDKMLILRTADKKYTFSGTGASRLLPMFERIVKAYQTPDDKGPVKKIRPVLAQGGIDIYVVGPLSVKGEFVLNRDEMKLMSYSSVVTKIAGRTDLTIPLKEGLVFLEGSTKQKLGFKFRDQEIWIGGSKVTVIHFFLRQLNSYIHPPKD